MIAELLLSLALAEVPNICDIEGPPEEECKECTEVGDPVNLTTGFTFHDATDFAIDTGKGSFVLKRYYMPVGALGGSKSPLTTIIGEAWPKNAPPGPFGTPAGEQRPVWSNDLFSFVEPCPVSDGGCVSPTGLALLFDGDFRWTTFNRDGGAGIQTPHRKNPGTPLRIEALPSAAGYRVIRQSGDQWFYLKLTASNANTGPVLLSAVYDRNGLLKYTLTYPGSGCLNRPSALTFASGRVLSFNYTAGCLLQSITSGAATLSSYSYWNSDAGLLSAGGDPTSHQGYRYPIIDAGFGLISGEFQVLRAAAPDAGVRASHASVFVGMPITSYSGGGSDFNFSGSFSYTSYDEGFATPYLGCSVITDDVGEDGGPRIGVPLQYQFERSAIRNTGELSAAPGVSTTGTITVGSYNDDLFGRGVGSFAWRTDSCSTGTCPLADDAGVATVISRVAPLSSNNNVCSDGRDGGSAAVPFATQNRRGWWSAERRVLSADLEQMSTIAAQGMDKAPNPAGSTMDTASANALQVQTLNASPFASDGIRLNEHIEIASALPSGVLTTIYNQRFVDAGTVTVGGKVLHGTFLELEWQRGNTKIGGAVTTQFRGTFFRRQRACAGASAADPLNRVLRVEGPCEIANENATACAVDDAGSPGPITEFTYFETDAGTNDVGRLRKITQYPNTTTGTCGLELTTTFANYTPEGFPQSVTDPNDVTRTFAFSGTKMTSSTVPTADGGVATTTYAYDADGQLRSIQFPEGNFEVFCRHADSTSSCDFSKPLTGRLEWRARSSSNDGFLAPERIDYFYWPDGTLQKESFGSTNPWLVKNHFADSLGRPTYDGLGTDPNNPGVYVTRRFDGNGNVLGVGTKSVNAGAGAPTFCGAGTPSPLCPEMVFDRADRLTRADLHPTTSTTERTCIDYDGQGNPRRVIQGCASNDTCGNNQSTGATTQCTNSGSPATDYDIDDFGQVVAVRTPWSGAGTVSETRYWYNALGRMVRKETQVMRNAGTYEEVTYDQLGRMRARRSVGPSGTTQLSALSWDTALTDTNCPSPANARTKGRLAYRDDTFGRTGYQYDPEGRVLAEFGQRAGGPTPQCDVGYTNSAYFPTTTYSYSKNGNLQTLRYPHGRTIIYGYGTGALTDRITSISYTTFNGSVWSSPNTLMSNIQWLPYGPLSSYTFDGNGNTHTVTNAFGKYASTPTNACSESVPSSAPDGTGRQTGVFVTRASGSAMLKKAYTWLGEELLTEQTCYPSLLQTTEERKTFEYDNTHRLTKESRAGHPQMTHGLGGNAINPTRATSYGYTSRGNRNAMTIDGCPRYFTIPGGINRDLLSVTAPDGTAGCQGRFSGPTLSWDADGRVTQNATAWYYQYTNFGYGNAFYGSLDSVYHTASIYNFGGAYNGPGVWWPSTYQYFYDAFNRRRIKVFPTGTTQEFFYDSGHNLLSDVTPVSINGTTFTIEDTVWLDGAPVAAIRGSLYHNGSAYVRGDESATATCSSLSDGAFCNAYMLISDRLKRPVMMIRKSTAEITQAASYDAFGNVNRIPVMAGMNDNNPNQTIATASLPNGDGGVGVVNLVRVRANYVVQPTNAVLLAGQTAFPATSFVKINAVSPYINLGAAGSATMTTANTGTPPAPSGGLPGMQSNEFEYYRTSAGLGVFTNLRMPGQYYDAELDVFENWNRFYEPSLGRYLSPEPMVRNPRRLRHAIGTATSVPPYAYALNNPLRNVDSTGLWVNVVYDPNTGTITATAPETGESISSFVWSGTSEDETIPFEGRIPTGDYTIYLMTLSEDYLILDSNDSHPGDDVDERTGRVSLRLHVPGASQGCVAIGTSGMKGVRPEGDLSVWRAVRDFIYRNRSGSDWGKFHYPNSIITLPRLKLGSFKVLSKGHVPGTRTRHR